MAKSVRLASKWLLGSWQSDVGSAKERQDEIHNHLVALLAATALGSARTASSAQLGPSCSRQRFDTLASLHSRANPSKWLKQSALELADELGPAQADKEFENRKCAYISDVNVSLGRRAKSGRASAQECNVNQVAGCSCVPWLRFSARRFGRTKAALRDLCSVSAKGYKSCRVSRVWRRSSCELAAPPPSRLQLWPER